MPNETDEVNPAIASRLHSGYHWRGVADPTLGDFTRMHRVLIILLAVSMVALVGCQHTPLATTQLTPAQCVEVGTVTPHGSVMHIFCYRRFTPMDADAGVFICVHLCPSAVSLLPIFLSSPPRRRGAEFRQHMRRHTQDRCTEPPFALGTGALEFWSFDKSGLGGR